MNPEQITEWIWVTVRFIFLIGGSLLIFRKIYYLK